MLDAILSLAMLTAHDAVIPRLPTNTNYGELRQYGDTFTIRSDAYVCNGRIQANGKVVVMWTCRTFGTFYPAVYEWNGSELRGRWGAWPNVRIKICGEIDGPYQMDIIQAREERR